MRTALLIFASITLLSGCKYFSHIKEKGLNEDFPKVVSTDSLKETVFVPTLENHFAENKNVIYSPTLLFAWDELRKSLHTSIIQIDSKDSNLSIINNSRSYINSLSSDEYSAETNVTENVISIRTFFEKALPFKTKFQKLDAAILFANTHVKGFGMEEYNTDVAKQVQILYYKNDNNFLIRLQPADGENEIILAKGIDLKGSFSDILARVNQLNAKGKAEHLKDKNLWKYNFSEIDDIQIPILKFNIDTHYKDLEGKTINNKQDTILVAYQRTALIFNEYGAKVESEAKLVYDADSLSEPIEKPHPKKLIFNKPFALLMKKTGSKYPYLAMKIETPELMLKNNTLNSSSTAHTTSPLLWLL